MSAGRFTVVGSGTVVPEGDRGCACHFVDLSGARVLLDCGPGAVQGLARHGLPWSELTHLVLSHFHADHVGALPGLFFGLKHGIHPVRTEPLDVWGPPGTRRLFERLADALGEFLLDPGFPVHIHELEAPGDAMLNDRIRLRVHPTPHTPESRAIRLESGAAALGYTGDTGPEETLASFFRGVDLLVSECSLLDEEVGDNHLSPGRVAWLAASARPGLLALTHIYPHVRAGHDVAALVRDAGYPEGRIEVAHDGWSALLGS